jgi:hypothetical protein
VRMILKQSTLFGEKPRTAALRDTRLHPSSWSSFLWSEIAAHVSAAVPIDRYP